MRWTDEGHRKTHCCRNPTPLSTCPGHCCRMKRLSTTRNSCVRQHPQSLCALPFYKPHLSTVSTLFLVRVWLFRYLFIPPVSSVVPSRTAPAHLHTSSPLHCICIGPASAANTGGHVQTALSNARRASCSRKLSS